MTPDASTSNSVTAGPSTRHVLILITCCALAAGLGETALRFALLPFRELLGNRIHLNPQAVWMAPLTDLVFYMMPVLAVYLVLRWVRGNKVSYTGAVLTGAFLACLTVVMITQRVSVPALAVLSLGVALQVARFSHKRQATFVKLVNGATVALLAICLIGTAVASITPWWAEKRLRASLPDPAPESPNVLLLVLDTVRGMQLGTYGYSLDTSPKIDSIAQRGVVFENAFSTAPWTLPSHASMFTGKWPHELGVDWAAPLDRSNETIAERLNEAGYATGGFAANIIYVSWLFGLDDGFSRFVDYRLSPSEVLGASNLGRALITSWNQRTGSYIEPGRYDARRVNDVFLGWLDGVEAGRPWFAFLNYFDAHDPYNPQEPYRTRFPGTREEWRSLHDLRVRPPEELRALQAAYDGAIASLDQRVGDLLTTLKTRGALDNTVVIIVSDHGEEFGEHGHTGHGTSQYVQVLHVPLIVVLPDSSSAGMRIQRFVSLRDLAATIEDLTVGNKRRLPGHSLRPLWSGDTLASLSPIFSDVTRIATLPDRYPIAASDIQSLMNGNRWHLIRPLEGSAELYDLVNDPGEARNLAGDSTYRELLGKMTDSLIKTRGF